MTIILPRWQIWDGHYYPIRVGSVVTAALEFSSRSEVTKTDVAEPSRTCLENHRYRVVATVLQVEDLVVLDLGDCKVVNRIHPGQPIPDDYVVGASVEFELALSLNAWADSPWEERAHRSFGVVRPWRVERITRFDFDGSNPMMLTDADTENVDSDGGYSQYCIVDLKDQELSST